MFSFWPVCCASTHTSFHNSLALLLSLLSLLWPCVIPGPGRTAFTPTAALAVQVLVPDLQQRGQLGGKRVVRDNNSNKPNRTTAQKKHNNSNNDDYNDSNSYSTPGSYWRQ
ncbi:hypothetical protein B484DRAFT_286632 [Ochromonadaceae sp. CCMP2298]|nr:hypothetical protein B484DRAFT_286632 [Ochromonadaceae sp. CCMP2298]